MWSPRWQINHSLSRILWSAIDYSLRHKVMYIEVYYWPVDTGTPQGAVMEVAQRPVVTHHLLTGKRKRVKKKRRCRYVHPVPYLYHTLAVIPLLQQEWLVQAQTLSLERKEAISYSFIIRFLLHKCEDLPWGSQRAKMEMHRHYPPCHQHDVTQHRLAGYPANTRCISHLIKSKCHS